MPLLTLPRTFHVNSAGSPYALAKLYHYRASTLTTLDVYTDSGMGTPHAQPIEADANGIFPAIYVNTASGYDLRLILRDSAGNLIYDEDDIPRDGAGTDDLIPTTNGLFDIGAANWRWRDAFLESVSFFDGSGFYTTVSPSALSANRTITIPDADLTLGAMPVRTVNANYTWVMGDVGHTLYHTSATPHTFTIPVDASVDFPDGTIVEVDNLGIGTVTISSSATIYHDVYPYTGSIVLATGQMARFKTVATNAWTALLNNRNVNTPGSFTATLTGMTGSTTGTINYVRTNNLATLYVPSQIAGTSNTTAMTLTGLPAAIGTSLVSVAKVPCLLRDNGVTRGGWADIGSAAITFYLGMETPNAAGFTNSGSKGLPADCTIIYPLTYV
jgi:hypothetical protein